MTVTPARASIAALLASTLLLAGCNGNDDNDGKDKPSGGSASESTSGSPSAADPSTKAGGSGSSPLDEDSFYETIVRAQQDAGSYRSTATTTTAGQSIVLEGEATYDGDEILAHAKSTPQSQQQVESVVADGVLYLKGQGMGIPAGKWLKIDPDDPANAGNPLASLAAVADPAVALQATGDLQDLELVGPEKVDGVETSHYRATMLTSNYAKTLGLPADAAKLLPPKLPFDMWIDAENRPVKFSLDFEISGMRSSSVQEYSDYGSDIDVSVPADGDTVTPTDIGQTGS